MTLHRSACPLDCPDNCTVEATVEDGRVTRLDGGPGNPATAGFLCAKVRHFDRRLYAPQRLLHPGVREGRKGEGRFRQVGWEEALDLVASRLLEVRGRSGGEAILPYYYGGSNGALTQNSSDARLFRRLGSLRLMRTLCAAPTGAASQGLYGKMPGVGYPDYLAARLIIIWGCNPAVTGIHLMPIVQQAQDSGATLVVVDPRRTRLARRADLHLALRPGTDLPVALALINRLFESGAADLGFLSERTTGWQELRRRASGWSIGDAAEVAGIPAEQLERLAGLYAGTSPAVIRCGWGLERNRCGGSAVAAVLALPAVAGKFGVRGGGFTMSNSAAYRLGPGCTDPEPPTRAVNMNHLGRLLHDDRGRRVELLFVYNANPLMTVPDQNRIRTGLEREDLFTVVFEQVMTDTARYADVILPATTFLEHEELSRGYGAYAVQHAGPVVAAAGEARPNYEVFTELCRRTGLARPGDEETPDAMVHGVMARTPGGDRIRQELRETGVSLPMPGGAPIQLVDVFPLTSDGRIHLCPEEMDAEARGGLYHYEPDPATRRFPLALISPSSDRTISSTLGEAHRKQEPVHIHPADAAPRAIADGDPVRLFNELGEVHCLARLSAEMRPGVVSLAKGLWSHNTLNGATATALAPDTLTDVGAGACFNDARVEIEKLGPGAGGSGEAQPRTGK